MRYLRERRDELGLTQDDVARLVGELGYPAVPSMCRAQVGRIERSERVGRKYLIAICEVLRAEAMRQIENGAMLRLADYEREALCPGDFLARAA